MKVALCLIARLENLYLDEFINYYNKIGIDHIYIYDNNFDGEDNIHNVTQKYEDNNYVTIINVNNKTAHQIKAYYDCYKNYGDEYDWMCFFDIDEFLYLAHFNNIKDYLSQEKFNNFDIIAIPWVCYGDSERLFYENKPVQKRFTIPVQPYNKFTENAWLKPIIRTNIKDFVWDDNLPFSNPHMPVFAGINNHLINRVCGVHGQPICPVMHNVGDICQDLYNWVHLKHYWSKSTEEYIIKKIKQMNIYNLTSFDLNEAIDQYFKFNTFSTTKLNVLINVANAYINK